MTSRIPTRHRPPKAHRISTMNSTSGDAPPDHPPPRRRPRRRGRRSGVGRHKDRKMAVAAAVIEPKEESLSQPKTVPTAASPEPKPESPVPSSPPPAPSLDVTFDPFSYSQELQEPSNDFSPFPSTLHDTTSQRWLPPPVMPPPPSMPSSPDTHPRPKLPFSFPISQPTMAFSRASPPRHRAAVIGKQLPIPAAELPETKPFPVTAPAYTDADLGVPRAYSPHYPHPLSAYVSPAVNPATVLSSGYVPLFEKLDKRTVLGTILAECGKDLDAPALMLDPNSREGCGVPEKYWVPLCHWAGVKVPMGAIVPAVRSRRYSLDHVLTHTRSDTDLHARRAMGPRRASLPDLYGKSGAELPTRYIRNPPAELPRHRPFNVLAPVDEADDEVPPVKRPIEPIGAQRARLFSFGATSDRPSTGVSTTSSVTPPEIKTPTFPCSFATTSNSLKSEPTGYGNFSDEQREFATRNFDRIAAAIRAIQEYASHMEQHDEYKDFNNTKTYDHDVHNTAKTHTSTYGRRWSEGSNQPLYSSPTEYTFPPLDIAPAAPQIPHGVNDKTFQEMARRFDVQSRDTPKYDFKSTADATAVPSQPARAIVQPSHAIPPISFNEQHGAHHATAFAATCTTNPHSANVIRTHNTSLHNTSRHYHTNNYMTSTHNDGHVHAHHVTPHGDHSHNRLRPGSTPSAFKSTSTPASPTVPTGHLPELWEPQHSTTLEFSTGMSIWT